MELVGPSLTLRPVAPEDLDRLFVLGSDPEVTRWFSWGPYASVEEPRRFIADQVGRRDRGEALALAMHHAQHGLVGVTELTDVSPRDHRAVVGTWFARPLWGSGLNGESKRLVALLAFGHCGFERLGAYADVRNARSQAALIKEGFRHEGTLRGYHRHGTVQKDVAVFSMLRAEWADDLAAELRGAVPPAFVMRPPA